MIMSYATSSKSELNIYLSQINISDDEIAHYNKMFDDNRDELSLIQTKEIPSQTPKQENKGTYH